MVILFITSQLSSFRATESDFGVSDHEGSGVIIGVVENEGLLLEYKT